MDNLLLLIVILMFLNVSGTVFLIRRLAVTRVEFEASIKEIKDLVLKHDREISNRFISQPVAAPPEPNEAVQREEEVVPLDEQSPWQIPQDVKVEVEGGDTQAPPEYEVVNAASQS